MIELKLLTGRLEEIAELQRVLEESPTYSRRLTGHPPGAADAQATYSALPPGKGREDKFVFGVYREGRMVGCMDLIRAYPDGQTAMLGLLLISEREHRRGLGSAAFRLVENIVAGWAGLEKIRIGIVATNHEVTAFWQKMGFRDTGVRKSYMHDEISSETAVLEKVVVPRKTEMFLAKVSEWARTQPAVYGVLLVGSVARGDEGPDSDIDLVILTEAKDTYLQNSDWLKSLGSFTEVKREEWGVVTSLRVWFESGLELEFGLTLPSWASVDPMDHGTRLVVQEGARILYDPKGLLQKLIDAF